MKKITGTLILLAAVLTFQACERPIDIELDNVEPKVVFEGWITDAAGPYRLHISRTNDVFDNIANPEVSGATVVITDDLGHADTLAETSPGWYETGHLQGQLLATYTMRATVDGKDYVAMDKMPRINPIDTLIAYYQDSTYILGEGLYPVMVAREPAGAGDFFLFRVWKNDTLYDEPGDYWLADDRFADGQLAIFQFPYAVESGDTVVVEIQSLTRQSYDYYFTFLQGQFNSGGPFGSPPDNLKGNVSNDGQGYFGAYGSRRDTLIVP